MNAVKKRNLIKEYLKSQTIGPIKNEEEEMTIEPWKYYISGVLFPLDNEENSSQKYVIMEDALAQEEDSDLIAAEQVSTLSGKLFPSSMGIEAKLENKQNSVKIIISYAAYKKKKVKKSVWKRIGYKSEIALKDIIKNNIRDKKLKGVTAFARIITRIGKNSIRLKVFIVNNGKKASDGDEEFVYQPEIEINAVDASKFLPFQPINFNVNSLEDRLLYIRNRKKNIYAVGYGCAVEWEKNNDDPCIKIKSTFLPEYESKPQTFNIKGIGDVLSLHKLSFGLLNKPERVIADLREFAEKYNKWIENLLSENNDLDSENDDVRTVIESCQNCYSRIKSGIDLIESDLSVQESFALANLSMLMQAAHRSGIAAPEIGSDLLEIYKGLKDTFFWRPFQLAFLLLCIEPAVNQKSTFRDCVDLIWFPTGGGKTEAYLCVTAFTIFNERLRNPGFEFGTTVISRYTLRLLTTQQFERTAALTCSMELLRKNWTNDLGNTPISLGLWLGGEMTPNRIRDAENKLDQLFLEDEPQKNNPFMLNNCPCCQGSLLPERRDSEEKYGFKIENQELIISCMNKNCVMSLGIPVFVIDEQIYENLPTILIGTIDKFARLAWLEKTGWLLTGKNGKYPTVALIIQDELHLISGPLGSLAGVYENAIEALCSINGIKSRMIASTATVRRSDEQCTALYGRIVNQFPPPGLEEGDSFFAKEDLSNSGRIYVGLMAPHVTSITASVRLHAILLQSVIESTDVSEQDDNYWTLVSYFNSIRELGSATTLAADDIPDRIKVIQNDPEFQRKLQSNNFIDLYGARKGTELNDILQRLNLSFDKPDEISLLLTTNIISVGVDVDRLGLMIVNGQPKTTAEYIQATSRVGRSLEMPGLVVTLYSAIKPRDRSHFESFIPYHSMINTFVEPSSVTPFSKPSREKALHAIMVILARHLPGGMPKNHQAAIGQGENLELINQIAKIIKDRCKIASPYEVKDLNDELRYRISQWREWSKDALHYDSNNTAITSLLHRKLNAPDYVKGWRTMDSMRSVDFETRVKIEGVPR